MLGCCLKNPCPYPPYWPIKLLLNCIICCCLNLLDSSWKFLILSKEAYRIGIFLADLTWRLISSSSILVLAWTLKFTSGPSLRLWVNKFLKKITIGDSICSNMYSLIIYSVILYLILLPPAPLEIAFKDFILPIVSLIYFNII